MNDFKLKAINLFELNMPDGQNEIKTIKNISNGFTNNCYLVMNTKNEKYQVRVGNDKISRNNETIILNALKDKGGFIYYDVNNGNAIKKWFIGKTPSITTCKTNVFLNSFAKELTKLQKLPADNNISKRNFYMFEKIANFNGLKKQFNKYFEIIEKHKNLPLVVSHNDLRPSNLIWNGKNLKFIDFEWATLNNCYWDLCNFLREIEFPIKKIKKVLKMYFKNLDYKTVLEFLFATTFFAYQWTFFPDKSKNIIQYRKNTKRLMTYYYNLLLE